MYATGETVALAEWIVDDTTRFFCISFFKKKDFVATFKDRSGFSKDFL